MTLKRNYLTAEEIAFVTEKMLSVETEFERQVLRYGVIAQLLVDGLEENEDTNCNDYWNQLMKNAIDLDKEVYNIQIVDKIVERELGVAKTVEKILNGVIAQIDESMKAIDPKALVVELDKLKDSDALKMLAKA
jgi:hypothetical protein